MKGLALAAGVAVVALGLTLGVRAQAKPETVKGHLMDVACATTDVSKGAAVIEAHDKACLLMAPCVKSGYAIVTADMKMIKLDAKGNEDALKFINATTRDKDWKVTANGTIANGVMSVSSLSLQ